MSAVKGKFGNSGACYKAPDLVKILKVRRRWESTEGGRIVEAERMAGAKAHGRRKHCVAERLRQAPLPGAQRASMLHKVLMNIQGRRM